MRRRKIFKQDVQQTHFSKVDVLDIDIPFNSLAISFFITAEDQFRNTKHSCSSTITTTDIQNGKASSKLLVCRNIATTSQKFMTSPAYKADVKACRRTVTNLDKAHCHDISHP